MLLVFYKASCPTCQLTMPYLNRVAMRVVGVSQDDAEETREFVERNGLRFECGLDPGYAKSNEFGIEYVPTMFVVDDDGLVSETIDGFDRAALERLGVVFASEERVPIYRPG